MAFKAERQCPENRYRRVIAAGLGAVVCVLLLQPLFLLGLTVVRAHTDLAAVRGHILNAYQRGVLATDERPRRLIDRYGHQFTECTALHLSIDDEPDALKAALLPQLHSQYIAPCSELERTAAGIASQERTDYSRYWHGYRIYIWPMLELFSLSTIRYINGLLLLTSMMVFFGGFRRSIGSTAAAVFFLVLMSLTDIWRLWPITTHFLSTAFILAGTGLFAYLYRRPSDQAPAIIYAAVTGAIFNFVDFLINPPLMPMLLAFIVIAVATARTPHPTRRFTMDTLIASGLIAASWFGGYALTWSVKWVLAILYSDHSSMVETDLFHQILLRMYGQEADAATYIIPLLPTMAMIAQSFLSAGSVAVALLAAALFIHVRGHWMLFQRSRFLLLMSPTVIPILWFELLSNHTQTHSHFTYRSESAAIAIFFAATILATPAQTTLMALLSALWAAILKSVGRESRDGAIITGDASIAARVVFEAPIPSPDLLPIEVPVSVLPHSAKLT
jgi:hypothetical protein